MTELGTALIRADDFEEMQATASVTLHVKAKHADLWRAAKKMGGVRQLAEHLGLQLCKMYNWINMREMPKFRQEHPWANSDRRRDLEAKLLALTGKTFDQIWPEDVYTQDFLDMSKSTEIDVQATAAGLLGYQNELRALPSPEQVAEQHECRDMIRDVIGTLPARYADVIRRRYGIEYEQPQTLDEVAAALGVTRERIRQMEKRALETLQHESRAQQLIDYDPGVPSWQRQNARLWQQDREQILDAELEDA